MRRRISAAGSSEQRSANYKCKYGITLEDYVSMYIKQKGVCEICGISDSPDSNYEERARLYRNRYENGLVVDHDHVTKKVRGLIHRKCNSGIGLVNDDAKILRGAVAYLKKHNNS